jgi:hypothetical protein
MAKWVLVVGTNSADTAREAEFNEWYDKIHLPDVLESSGFIGATRYENIEPLEGEAKFLAIYEIETNDIDETMKALADHMAGKRAEGRYSELLVVVSRAIYRQTSSLYK